VEPSLKDRRIRLDRAVVADGVPTRLTAESRTFAIAAVAAVPPWAEFDVASRALRPTLPTESRVARGQAALAAVPTLRRTIHRAPAPPVPTIAASEGRSTAVATIGNGSAIEVLEQRVAALAARDRQHATVRTANAALCAVAAVPGVTR